MKLILISLMILSQASVLNAKNADDEFEINMLLEHSNKPYFETLGELYLKGGLPDLKKLSNLAWAGRCFHVDRPNEPVAGVYLVREANIDDAGPLGGEIPTYEAKFAWSPITRSDYFDKMPLSDVYKRIGNDSFHIVKINSESVEISNGTTFYSNLRLSGEYLIEEIKSLNSRRYIRTPYIRCYYFISNP